MSLIMVQEQQSGAGKTNGRAVSKRRKQSHPLPLRWRGIDRGSQLMSQAICRYAICEALRLKIANWSHKLSADGQRNRPILA